MKSVKLTLFAYLSQSTSMQTKVIPYHIDITDIFQPFSGLDKAVLFDSGKPEQLQGRYDIFTALPTRELYIDKGQHWLKNKQEAPQKIDANAFHQQLSTVTSDNKLNHLPFSGGWIGFASYELGYLLEPEMGRKQEDSQLPEFWAGYYDWAIIQDHKKQTAELIFDDAIAEEKLNTINMLLTQQSINESFTLTDAFKARHNKEHYQQQFGKIKDYLSNGDCYQVNFAQQFKTRFEGSPYTAYQKLRQTVPSPFMTYLAFSQQQQIVSISPERFLSSDGETVSTKPIKGTAPRATTLEEDNRIAQELVNSMKNRAENLMIVDLMRNDLGKHSKTGSVKVNQLFTLESFNNVHHLVSEINSTIDDNANIWDIFFSCFPGGSITGAPKIRACQIINELEDFNREIYCGSLFYASNNGFFDSNIAIRTLLFSNNDVYAWAGGGIVQDSDSDSEFQECLNKISHLLQAIEQL